MEFKKKRVWVFVILIGLLSINLISASFAVGNLSNVIKKNYGAGEKIEGWINISFTSETTNNIFNSSLGEMKTLLSVINSDSNFNRTKTCVPSDCQTGYSGSNQQSSKTFQLNAGEEKIIGMKLTGMVASVNSMNFSVQSSAAADCYNQLKMDFLNDGTYDYGNTLATSEICATEDGCFDSTIATEDYVLDSTTPYCQKIRFPEGAGFNIGAWIKQVSSGSQQLNMDIYTSGADHIGGCTLVKTGLTASGGRVSCSVNLPLTTEREYYVCVSAEDDGGEYHIRGYSSGTHCGLRDLPHGGMIETTAYDIFIEKKKYGAVTGFNVENELADEETLSNLAQQYLMRRYGTGTNCTDGCYIPIKFKSYKDQQITISGLSLRYEKIGGPTVSEDFFDLQQIPATISTNGYKLLRLDNADFSVPTAMGNHTFKLYLNQTEIFSEQITIMNVPKILSLNIDETYGGYPTDFRIAYDSARNITRYLWDFGDGNKTTTTRNSVIHSYNSTGTYNLDVTIVDSGNYNDTASFDVYVGSPESIINQTLKNKQKFLEDFKTSINGLPEFDKTSFETELNTEGLEDTLMQIEREYAAADEESEFIELMIELIGLKIPKNYSTTNEANDISFIPSSDEINLDILKEIGGGDYDSDRIEDYKDAILLWNQEKLNSKIDYSELTVRFDDDTEAAILRRFKINVNILDNLPDDPYFIIENISNLKFKENYLEDEVGDYVYIELKEENNEIEFTTGENVNFINLPAFISPRIERLILEELTPDEPPGTNWSLFVLLFILLIVIAIACYTILQQWYKRRYENYLFGNRNNLFNIVSYINNSKEAGLNPDQIKANLKRSGWNYEQINYAMKKYQGKNTGLPEIIPIDKLMNLFKRKKKITPQGNFNRSQAPQGQQPRLGGRQY